MTYPHIKTLIKNTVIASGIGLLAMTHSFADVTLQVDDNIKVTVINGKAVNQSLLQPLKKTFRLQPGKQVVTARYDRLYDLRRDEHDYVKSKNISVTANMQDNQTYKLVMPNQPERYKDAKEYVKNPTLAIMQGSRVIAKETNTSDNEGGLFSGLTGLFGIGDDAQQSNQQAIAAVSTTASNKPTTTSYDNSSTRQTTTVNANNKTVLDRFMQLWLNATPDERAKIRQWVAE